MKSIAWTIAPCLVAALWLISPLDGQESRATWVRDATLQTAAPEPPQRIVVPRKACPSLEELGYQSKSLPEIALDIGIRNTRLPDDCSVNLFTSADVVDPLQTERTELEFYWVASELYHQPLYFDDRHLERYGYGCHPLVQPGLSGAHFFGNFVLMPYKLIVDPTHLWVSTLGQYRPGSW